MPDQLRDIVARMVAAGESEEDIAAVIQRLSVPAVSHEPSPDAPTSEMPMIGGGRGTGYSTPRQAKNFIRLTEEGPMIGGMIGAPLAGIPGAAVGGQIGSLVRDLFRANRGDPNTPKSFGEAVTNEALNAAEQAALMKGGDLVSKGLQKAGGVLYRGAIPKAIQDKFARANLVESGLGSRTLLGTTQGVNTAGRAKTVAGHGLGDVAETVPDLMAQDIQAAFGPKYNKALLGGKTDKAIEIGQHVSRAMKEIGPGAFSGPSQLARKEFLEQEGKAAMGAVNPNLIGGGGMHGANPQLANIERKAIVANLRRSPKMAQALDKAQAAIGMERAARATENSTLLNRLSHGGVFNALKSPMGFSGAGIIANEAAKVPSAQALRAIALLQLLQDQP